MPEKSTREAMTALTDLSTAALSFLIFISSSSRLEHNVSKPMPDIRTLVDQRDAVAEESLLGRNY